MKKDLGAKIVAFPTPVYIVSTYGDDDAPNGMNVAWGGCMQFRTTLPYDCH